MNDAQECVSRAYNRCQVGHNFMQNGSRRKSDCRKEINQVCRPKNREEPRRAKTSQDADE